MKLDPLDRYLLGKNHIHYNTYTQTAIVSYVEVTCHESKSNCMLNFKEEHLFRVYQTTTDVAKSNNYQS